MKVGIDTFGCNHGASGLGIYIKSLANCMKNDDSVEFEFFGAEEDKYNFNSENGFEFVSVTFPQEKDSVFLWHLFGFEIFCKQRQYDMVIVPAALKFIPYRSTIPIISIVNELLSANYDKLPFLMRLCIRGGLKNSAHVIVPSLFLKKNIKKLHIKENKISVVHNGIDHNEFCQKDSLDEELVEKNPISIQKPYFVYASKMSSPEKRHCELVEAFSRFRNNTKFTHRLVLTGNEGEYFQDVQKAVSESPFASDIFITGYFPHEQFPKLYAESDGVIFPSENEAVGIQIVEAMATGVPVACSKLGALPEMAGENVLFFDSRNPTDISEKLELLAKKDSKAFNVSSEISWAKRFDWSKTAEEVLNIIKSVKNK